MRRFYKEGHKYNMKTHWSFGVFFLKLSDEKNGTHEYEEYLRNCKKNPLTEKEQHEWTESARAAIAEMEQMSAEAETTCLLYTSPSPRDA